MTNEILPGGLLIPKRTILHVDDDQRILRLANAMLSSQYQIASVMNPLDALAMLRAEPREVLITDGSMPEMPGEELAYIERQERPKTAILLLSADIANHQKYPGLFDAEEPKPFRARSLNDAIIRALTNSQKRLRLP